MLAATQVLADYDTWLERQALAPRTRTAYRRWVRELVEYLAAGDELAAFLAADGEHDRRALVGDWRRRLVDRRLAPSTVNLALAAATSLLDSRALERPAVRRVEVDPKAPRALSRDQLRIAAARNRSAAVQPRPRDPDAADADRATHRRARRARARRPATDPAHGRTGDPSRQGRSPAAGPAQPPGTRSPPRMAGRSRGSSARARTSRAERCGYRGPASRSRFARSASSSRRS